jgi:ABC-2 type transport system ATP-binding protein
LTSHELPDVERLADRICLLVAGRVVASGTASELAAGLRPRLRFAVDRPLGVDDLDGLKRALGAAVAVSDDDGYEVADVAPTPGLLAALATWCEGTGRLITWSRASGGTLEDAYLELVGRDEEPRVDG